MDEHTFKILVRGITDSMNMSFSKLWVMVKDRESWCAAVSWGCKESDTTEWLNKSRMLWATLVKCCQQMVHLTTVIFHWFDQWTGFYTLMCMCVQSLHSYLTLCYPMDSSLMSGSFGHGLFWARIPEWVASPTQVYPNSRIEPRFPESPALQENSLSMRHLRGNWKNT